MKKTLAEIETEMEQYLTEKGWKCCGPLRDVWKFESAKPVLLTLHRAYRTQIRWEAKDVKADRA